MSFFSKIGSEIVLLLSVIGGVILLFFTFRSRYLNRGRNEAIEEIHGKNIEQLYKDLKNAQSNSKTINNSDDIFIDELLDTTDSEYDEWGRNLSNRRELGDF